MPAEPKAPTGSPDIVLASLLSLKKTIKSIVDGRAGLAFLTRDERREHYWSKDCLGTIQALFAPRAEDAYVVWLKPVVHKQRLTIFEYQNLPVNHDHHEFSIDEGLAGKVWVTGTPATHSPQEPHAWWKSIGEPPGMTYLCVPIDGAEGNSGVLAVGSYVGFRIQDTDLTILSTFAEVLRLVSAPPTAAT
jgi:GAF domain-containing protein